MMMMEVEDNDQEFRWPIINIWPVVLFISSSDFYLGLLSPNPSPSLSSLLLWVVTMAHPP